MSQVKIAKASRPLCPEWHPPDDKTDYGENQNGPPEIPAEFREIISASGTVVTVQSLVGKPVCVPLSWIYRIDDPIILSDDKRFLGFSTTGFESQGYLLVDRLDPGETATDTGTSPTFSDDRTMLASVPENESGEYQVDGIGVWQILPNRVVERMIMKRDDMPLEMDWRIDRWSGNRCVELSAIPRATFEDFVRAHHGDDSPEALARVRRDHFRLSPVGGKWRIEPSISPAPCFRIDGAG